MERPSAGGGNNNKGQIIGNYNRQMGIYKWAQINSEGELRSSFKGKHTFNRDKTRGGEIFIQHVRDKILGKENWRTTNSNCG